MHLIVNFITKLLIVVEKNTVLVIYNRLSKMIYFVTTTEGTSAKRLGRLFRDNCYDSKTLGLINERNLV